MDNMVEVAKVSHFSVKNLYFVGYIIVLFVKYKGKYVVWCIFRIVISEITGFIHVDTQNIHNTLKKREGSPPADGWTLAFLPAQMRFIS